MVRFDVGAATFVLAVATTGAARGQALLHRFDGTPDGGWLGTSVACAGDVNGDGYDDVVAGAANPWDSSYARVYSGKDGSLLHHLLPMPEDPGFDDFGTSVDGAGDVDGDGYDDVVVGNLDLDSHAPASTRVYSGLTGALIFALHGGGSNTGLKVAGAGDVNGDGVPDLIAGGPEDLGSSPAAGAAEVFSGADGSTLFRFLGDDTYDYFGFGVAGAGDVNGDGRADLAVGAYLDDDNGQSCGKVSLFSGADGSLLWERAGPAGSVHLGLTVDGLGDVSGDGVPDVVAGGNPGAVLSGADGSVLYDVPAWYARSAGDVNGDGYPDIVGVHFDTSYVPHVYSGRDGALLFTFAGPQAESVDGAGDVNGDGVGDFVIGDSSVTGGRGSVWVYLGGCREPSARCLGAPNSVGSGARIQHAGGPAIVANNFELRTASIPHGELGMYAYGDEAVQLPFGDGYRCIGGRVFRLGPPMQLSGTAARLVDFTRRPASDGPGRIDPGSTWHFQLWYRDPGGPGGTGFNFSDALRTTFCP